MTSIARSSMWLMAGMLSWFRRVRIVTRVPASRQTLAAACSSGTPLLLRTPAREHAARWSPKGSRMRRHRQVRSVKGSGSLRRPSMRTRKTWSGYVTSAVYGMVVKVLLANGPDCESRMAWLAGSSVV